MKTRIATAGTAVALVGMVGSLALPGAAQASTKGRRNTTIGLGAAAAYELLHHKTTNGLILGAGTAYAYKQYRKSQKNDRRRHRIAAYRHRTASSHRYRYTARHHHR